MNETITELISKLDEGGEFPKSHRNLYMFLFERNEEGNLTLERDERSGVVRSLICEVVDSLGLHIVKGEDDNNKLRKFEYVDLYDEDRFAKLKMMDRSLTNGDYDFDKKKISDETIVHKELRGKVRVAIPGTNIEIRDVGICSGNKLFVFACHVDYKKKDAGDKAKAKEQKTDVDKELADII